MLLSVRGDVHEPVTTDCVVLDAPGVFLAILIAASGDENAAVVRRRRPSLVRESPLRCLARGPRVPLIAAVSARVCVLGLRTLRTTPLQVIDRRRDPRWRFCTSGSPGWTSARRR